MSPDRLRRGRRVVRDCGGRDLEHGSSAVGRGSGEVDRCGGMQLGILDEMQVSVLCSSRLDPEIKSVSFTVEGNPQADVVASASTRGDLRTAGVIGRYRHNCDAYLCCNLSVPIRRRVWARCERESQNDGRGCAPNVSYKLFSVRSYGCRSMTKEQNVTREKYGERRAT